MKRYASTIDPGVHDDVRFGLSPSAHPCGLEQKTNAVRLERQRARGSWIGELRATQSSGDFGRRPRSRAGQALVASRPRRVGDATIVAALRASIPGARTFWIAKSAGICHDICPVGEASCDRRT